MGCHARKQWQMYLLYNQRAGDWDGVYPFSISIQHLERLHTVLPENCETLRAAFFQLSGVTASTLDGTS